MMMLKILKGHMAARVAMRRVAMGMGMFAASSLVAVAAQALDEAAIKKLVGEEVQRLLNTAGAFDVAIEKGIIDFVRKTQAESDADADAEEVAFRPVDATRDHIFGNPEAPVTLVEYSDFSCPYCKRFHPSVVALLENNPGKVRWVYRHFPLSFHPDAATQAEASECVAMLGGNDAFWRYTHAIYERADVNAKFAVAKLRPLAEEFGVDGDDFAQCMASGEMAARVEQDLKDGMELGISGTPSSIFIGPQGEMSFAAGAASISELQARVDELLP